MGIEITAHIILEDLNAEKDKYKYIGNFSANFLHAYQQIDIDWRDEPDDELQEAFWKFKGGKKQIYGLGLLKTKQLSDCITALEDEISVIKAKRDANYHIVHTSKCKAAVEDAMEYITGCRGFIECRRKEINDLLFYNNALEMFSIMTFTKTSKDYDSKIKMHCLLEYW